jgi:hypothetical protein
MPYLFSQFRAESSPQIFKQYHFWIIVGIMTYLAGTFFFNILANELPKAQLVEYWYISYLGDILKNLLFTFAIYVYVKSSSKKPEKVKTLPNLDFTL